MNSFGALLHELDEAWKLHAQHVQQIRLLNMCPPGLFFEAPLPADHPRAPGREVLMHPDDWRALAEEGFAKAIEITMRVSGASHHEVDRERERLVADPEGARVFGIPVVDDSDAARCARAFSPLDGAHRPPGTH